MALHLIKLSVGIRDIDDTERAIVNASGVHAWTMREIDERGMAQVTREVLEVVGKDTAGSRPKSLAAQVDASAVCSRAN